MEETIHVFFITKSNRKERETENKIKKKNEKYVKHIFSHFCNFLILPEIFFIKIK